MKDLTSRIRSSSRSLNLRTTVSFFLRKGLDFRRVEVERGFALPPENFEEGAVAADLLGEN
jgi:hypothetical protein